MDSLGNEPMEMVALGRPFSLGMFYDCRSDKLVPGITLWDKDKLDRDKSVIPKPNTDFKIVASESLSDKSSSLGVDASLKASFMSGLVKVDGSAKYLNDTKKSTKQVRVTLQYKTTTVFNQLNMDQLGTGNLKHCEVIDKGLATHVVTAILYGAQAFFVFDQETSEDESVRDIQGHLKVMIKQIPLISVGGQGALKMDETDRAKVNKFSCTFHGDFLLEKSPTTFEESVRVYQDLPKLLGPNKENAVPVTVHLLPLSALDPRASKLVRQISLRLVTEAENILENFSELEIWCNDVMNSPAGQNFSHICKNIKTFNSLCSEFKLGLQGTLAQKLPAIRGGGEQESALADVLIEAAGSPFNSHRLNLWMKEKDRECNTIKTIMKLMKNTETICSENALTDRVCDSENALVFVLTSLDSTEPFLSELDQYLKRRHADRSDSPEPTRWYSSKDMIDSMRRTAKLFSDFADANRDQDKKSIRFLAVGLADENCKGSTIYLYEDGFRVSENFELPSRPGAVTVGEVTHSTVSLTFSAPSAGAQSITGYRVEFCEKGQEEWKQRAQAEAGEVTVSGLHCNTEYSVRVRAVTAVGVGPAAAPKGFIRTSPCGPPEEPTASVFSSKIRVHWRKPAQVGQGVQIHSYIVEYGQTQEDMQWKREQSQSEEKVISGLQPETPYTIRVLCDCGQHGTGHQSSTLNVTTTAQQSPQTVEQIRKRRCTAVYSYTPQNEDELELKMGDIIDIIAEVEKGWWMGVLNGTTGIFPSNFVKEIDLDSETASTDTSQGDLPCGRTSKDSTGSESDVEDSSSDTGSVETQPKKTLRSRKLPQSKSDHVPHRATVSSGSNSSSLTSEDEEQPEESVSSSRKARAMYACEAEHDSEHSFQVGAIFTNVTKSLEPGWLKGELDGKEGLIPENYVEML